MIRHEIKDEEAANELQKRVRQSFNFSASHPKFSLI